MSGRVDGKVAFITGAARGQGRAIAVRLAEEGADIVAVDACTSFESTCYPGATVADLEETVALVEATGRKMVARKADVRDLAELTAAVDEGVRRFGRLDIVSANAGISSPAPFGQMSEQRWQEMIDINLTGVWNTCKATVPHLIRGGCGGSIVFTSSAAGLKGFANVSHYVAAKHGVIGLMRSLTPELAADRIRVNAICPTTVDTPMIQNEATYRLFSPHNESPTRDDFASVTQNMQALPIPWIEPIDAANGVLFLASDEARYVTGVALPLDGGLLQK